MSVNVPNDDAICLKTRGSIAFSRPVENVTITNCVLSSLSNALKMGTESTGGCKNLTVANCAIRKPRPSQRGLRSYRPRGPAAE